jgi:beta-phosphoglucomutase
MLSLLGVAEFFEVIVSSKDTQRGKPDPQVFLVAAQRLELPPVRSVVFEDALAGVQAAKAGGMKCIAVCAAGHKAQGNLKNAGADLVVASLAQVDAHRVRDLLG